MKDNNKKNKIMAGISIALIIVLIIGATYAYFASQKDKNKSADINITADTTDTLVFKTGSELSIRATTENFAKNSGSLTDSTDATAILRANSTNNQSETFTYNVYLLIAENTFQYSSESEYQYFELTINLKGPDGEIKTIDGLRYSNSLQGFDVTTKKGLYKIATNKEISTTSMLEEKWEATVTFWNYSFNQAHNGGASFQAKLVLSSEELTLSDYVQLAYEAAPNNSINYHDSNLAYSAEDLSYRYSGPSYILTNKAINEGYESIYGDNGILVDDGSSVRYELSYSNDDNVYIDYEGILQAVEDGYLKEGNANNYVCFGSSDCTDRENLYRMIGAFNVDGEYQVKLIKASEIVKSDLYGTSGAYAGESTSIFIHSAYSWINTKVDAEYYNIWKYSLLNKTNLNSKDIDGNPIEDGFIYNIGTGWSDLIAEHVWTVAGTHNDNIRYSSTVKEAYQYEMINYDIDVDATYKDKVGLMYVSDYLYAAPSKYWSLPIDTNANHPDANGNYGEEYDYGSTIEENWMHIQRTEKTITRASNRNVNVFYISGGGTPFGTSGSGFYTRPAFYLKSNVPLVSGSGTYYDPFIIME